MKNPRPLLCALCILVVGLFYFSCEENEIIGPEQLLVTLKANHVYSNCGYPQAVVTDSQGRVLAVSEVNGAVDMPIFGPLAENDQSVNLYLLSTTEKSYHITAYIALKKGTEFSGMHDDVGNAPSHEVAISLVNFPSYDNVILSSDVSGNSFTPVFFEHGPQRIFTSNNNLFVQMISAGEGKYGFVPLDGSANSLNLDPVIINIPSTKQRLDLKNIANGYLISISGSFSEHGLINRNFLIYRNSNYYDADVYYPSSGFTRYSTELNYMANSRYYTQIRTGRQPNFEFETIAFDAKVTNRDPANFSMDLTGDFDYYKAAFESNNLVSLTVYARRCDASYKLPDFSKIKGLKAFPSRSLTGFSVKLFDHAALQEDQRYFKHYSSASVDSECDNNVKIVTLISM